MEFENVMVWYKRFLPRKRIRFNELPNWNSLTIDAYHFFNEILKVSPYATIR